MDPGSDLVPAMRFGGPLPSQHRADIISPTASVEPPTLTVVAVYALPSRTRWLRHRRTIQQSATVLSQWLYQERGMACLLSHGRFVTVDVSPGTEDLSLPDEFSVTCTSAGRSSFLNFWRCIQRSCCIFVDNVKMSETSPHSLRFFPFNYT